VVFNKLFNKPFTNMWSGLFDSSFLRASFSREMRMVQVSDVNVMCPKCMSWRQVEDPLMFYMECDDCKASEYLSIQDQNLITGFKEVERLLRAYFKDKTITVKYSLQDVEAFVDDNKFGMSDMFSNEDLDCRVEDVLDRLNLKLEWITGGTFWLYEV